MAEETHDWHELARVIPWTDEDFDPAKRMPDHNDAEGNPVETEAPPLVPHIILQDMADPDKTTMVVPIPEDNYNALVAMLQTGEMTTEDLSRLPLSDLVPSAAALLSAEGAKRSGSSRGVSFAAVEVEEPATTKKGGAS